MNTQAARRGSPGRYHLSALLFAAASLNGMLINGACASQPQPTGAATLPYEGGQAESVRDHLSARQEERMWTEIQHNIAMLRKNSLLPMSDTALTVTYNFPLRMAPGLPDHEGFRVSAFADHNPAAGTTQVLDYSGGTRTYDSHRGTDFALWPFGWNKVDGGEVQVIAAAAGTIAYKSEIDPTDHNPCDGGSANDPWNFIGVVHGDGRLTIYGHMRYNSLTRKLVGDSVAQGEYLGTAASSGNSSGPHLHFEARYGAYSNNEWVDPYAGPGSQPESLWASQRPYVDAAINRLATHSSPASTANSCASTITHLQDSFTTLQNIFFYAYFRDYQGALVAQLKLHRPDGSVHQSWQYSTATPYSSLWSSAWVVNLPVDSPAGTWRFEAIYNGQTYETFFNVDSPTTITLATPNGGEQWQRLQSHSVTWADNLGGEVNIDLYRDNLLVDRLASNRPSNGAFPWTPGAELISSPGYRVRVTSVTNPDIQDSSDTPFTLIDAPGLFDDGFESSNSP